jgi:hypothetical protein
MVTVTIPLLAIPTVLCVYFLVEFISWSIAKWKHRIIYAKTKLNERLWKQ